MIVKIAYHKIFQNGKGHPRKGCKPVGMEGRTSTNHPKISSKKEKRISIKNLRTEGGNITSCPFTSSPTALKNATRRKEGARAAPPPGTLRLRLTCHPISKTNDLACEKKGIRVFFEKGPVEALGKARTVRVRNSATGGSSQEIKEKSRGQLPPARGSCSTCLPKSMNAEGGTGS